MVRLGMLAVAAALLAGCAQSQRDERVLTGAALGAGTGAVLGGLAGGTAASAAAGAVVGGVTGGAVAAAAPPPPPPPPETCYVRTRSGGMRPVPC